MRVAMVWLTLVVVSEVPSVMFSMLSREGTEGALADNTDRERLDGDVIQNAVAPLAG